MLRHPRGLACLSTVTSEIWYLLLAFGSFHPQCTRALPLGSCGGLRSAPRPLLLHSPSSTMAFNSFIHDMQLLLYFTLRYYLEMLGLWPVLAHHTFAATLQYIILQCYSHHDLGWPVDGLCFGLDCDLGGLVFGFGCYRTSV